MLILFFAKVQQICELWEDDVIPKKKISKHVVHIEKSSTFAPQKI